MRKVVVAVGVVCGVALAAYAGRSSSAASEPTRTSREHVIEDVISECMTFDGHHFVPSRRVQTFERTYLVAETGAARTRTIETSKLLTDICER